MNSSIRERSRAEGGFTLIELLVVMIIIAILMAVAVPTFLSQKQNAVATKTKANIKQIINAVESCAASNTSGLYVEGTNDCSSSARVGVVEPTLLPLFTLTAGAVYTVTGQGAGTGYTVTGTATGEGGVQVMWTEIHTPAGVITRTCSVPSNKACGGKATW